MKCRNYSSRHAQSGQVLAAGIFILVILLLTVFAGFDIYNTIRAKFKVETAQESAALAGAVWQRNSLNLIGEINLIKACSILLEGDDNWIIPLPRKEDFPELPQEEFNARRHSALQSRIDILTEMQSRISFIGPLIGLAAAQQAAKANGIPVIGNFDYYIRDLQTSSRYNPNYGGAAKYIHNYDWKAPYTDLVRTISANGVAVYPNAITGDSPYIYPAALGSNAFYAEIYRHYTEIKDAKFKAVYPQSAWKSSLGSLCKSSYWSRRFNEPPWWVIDYSMINFPNESEIFSIGVSTTDSESLFDPETGFRALSDAADKHLSENNRTLLYQKGSETPPPGEVELKLFSYDNSWYPEFFRQKYSDYDFYHYNYWFAGEVLRKHVKTQYRYEGPAAYVETHAEVGKTTSIINVGRYRNNRSSSVHIGTRRSKNSVSDLTDYRPGAIAKTLGSLAGGQPPIAVPAVLPVFNKVISMPTYMPIPYNFGVLRTSRTPLQRFLSWLSSQENLNNPKGDLPNDGEYYLEALRILVRDKDFRYYCFNPSFDRSAFDNIWRENPIEWHKKRVESPDDYQYSLARANSGLPGYLQEPNIFYQSGSGRAGTVREMPDYLNGGTAKRHYLAANSYIVVNSRGQIVNRDEPDPTISYKNVYPSGGGGDLGHFSSGYNDRRGPMRM